MIASTVASIQVLIIIIVMQAQDIQNTVKLESGAPCQDTIWKKATLLVHTGRKCLISGVSLHGRYQSSLLQQIAWDSAETIRSSFFIFSASNLFQIVFPLTSETWLSLFPKCVFHITLSDLGSGLHTQETHGNCQHISCPKGFAVSTNSGKSMSDYRFLIVT